MKRSIARLVLGVGLLHQRLLGVGTVGILRDQAPPDLAGAAPAALLHVLVRLVVEVADREAFVLVLVLEHALHPGAATAGDEGDERKREHIAQQGGAQRGGTRGHGHRAGAGGMNRG
jgi:hypothetical protein